MLPGGICHRAAFCRSEFENDRFTATLEHAILYTKILTGDQIVIGAFCERNSCGSRFPIGMKQSDQLFIVFVMNSQNGLIAGISNLIAAVSKQRVLLDLGKFLHTSGQIMSGMPVNIVLFEKAWLQRVFRFLPVVEQSHTLLKI